jgi:UDP-glucose 4-epimerase
VKIIDLAKMVHEKVKSSSKIIYVPYDDAYGEGFEDMMHRVPDISKISSLTGFEPKIGLPEIINSIINYRTQKGLNSK